MTEEVMAKQGLAASLIQDFLWLDNYITLAVETMTSKNGFLPQEFVVKSFPQPPEGEDLYARIIRGLYERQVQLQEDEEAVKLVHVAERLTLLLALVPYFRPYTLDWFMKADSSHLGMLGCIRGAKTGSLLPSGKTALYFLCGTNTETKFRIGEVLLASHPLYREGILEEMEAPAGEPHFNDVLRITKEFYHQLLTGRPYEPEYSTNFPAQHLVTHKSMDDLVLTWDTREQLEELTAWMKHGRTLAQESFFRRSFKRGYRCIFYGPSGTGKTLTASLLGKGYGKPVYRIDLSMIVSKWVGETEKNLRAIFDMAENRDWVLFFDEGEALFGKRTSTSQANDRYANQEIAYLLQRIEDFPGTLILATNRLADLDDAFTRRFQSYIYFPMPDPETLYILLTKAFPEPYRLEESIDLRQASKKYKLSGGMIENMVRFCILMAREKDTHLIEEEDFIRSIQREFQKLGKTI